MLDNENGRQVSDGAIFRQLGGADAAAVVPHPRLLLDAVASRASQGDGMNMIRALSLTWFAR